MSVLVHAGGGGGSSTSLSTPSNDTLIMSSMGSPPSNHPMQGPPHILPDTDVDAPMPSDLTHSAKGRLVPFSLSCLQTPGTPGAQFNTCFGLPYQDHNYGAPPPFTPPTTPPHSAGHTKLNGHYGIDDVSANTTVVTSDVSPAAVTTAENNPRNADQSSPADMGIDTGKTRCICDFEHDDGYMICCDRCGVWQHVDCMGLDRNTIPDAYFCELCEPRKLDKHRAVVIQTKKRQFLKTLLDSSATETEDETPQGKRRKANKFGRKKKDKMDVLPYTNGTKVAENSNHKCAKSNKHTPRKDDHSKPLKTLSQNTSPSPKKISAKRGSRSGRPDYALATSPIRLDWSGTGSDHSVGADAGSTYEEAEFNQYSIAVETLLATGKLNGQLKSEAGSVTVAQLRDQLCRVTNIAPNVKGIEVVENTLPGQPLIEYKGKVALRDQFDKHHNIYSSYEPFVLLYTKFADMDVCIDAQNYGCDARFIRRSCSPNAEVRHFVEGADIHFYIVSIKAISQGEEVTIPFDFDYSQCSYEVKCTCSRPKCPVQKSHHKLNSSHKNESKKKNKKLKRGSLSDKSGVLVTSPLHSDPKSPVLTKAAKKRRLSPLKIQPKSEHEDVHHSLPHKSHKDHHMKMSPIKSDHESSKLPSTPATPLTDDKKLTREEKKMEAIIKAFERLEKREERRKESIARIHHEADGDGAKETAGKIKHRRDTSKSVKEEDEEEATHEKKNKRNRRKSRCETEEEEVKEEEEVPHVDEEHVEVDLKQEPVDGEVKTEPTDNVLQPGLLKAGKIKKGKRKGRSLPASRRQSRAGSGSTVTTESCLSSEDSSSQPPDTPSTAPSLLPQQNTAFKFPKTKKHLMNEWLNGQQQEAASRPLTVHTDEAPSTDNHDDDAHFIRCTPSPHTSSLSHLLRRNSTSSSSLSAAPRAVTSLPTTIDHGLGSAKKRWLRQAMIDHEPNHLSPSGGASPSDNNSPNDSPTDFVTPLKKRRLARESLSGESPVPPPPTVTTSVAAVPDDEARVRDEHMFSPPPALIQRVGSPTVNQAEEACSNGSSGHSLDTMGSGAGPTSREIDLSSPPSGSVVGRGSPCTSGGAQWGEDYEGEVGTSSAPCQCEGEGEAHIDSSSVGGSAIVCSVTGDSGQCASRTVCGADNATSSSSSSDDPQRASMVHSTGLSSSVLPRGALCDSTEASVTNSTDPGPDGACSSSSLVRRQHCGTSPYSSDISSSASLPRKTSTEDLKCESSSSLRGSTEVGSSNLVLSREEGELDSSYSDTEAGGEPTVSCSWVDERENEALAKVESEKEEGEITDDEEEAVAGEPVEMVVEEPVEVEIDVVEEQVCGGDPTSSTEITSSDHHPPPPPSLLSEQFPITGGRLHGLLSPPPLSRTEPPPLSGDTVADSSSSSLSVDCAGDLVSSSEVSEMLSPSSSSSALNTKKKVSLLEYRKRIKSQSSRDSPGSSSSTVVESGAPDRPTPAPHAPTLAPLPMFGDLLQSTSPKPSSSKAGSGEKSEVQQQDVRWNASATLAERMREQTPLSLTERLRKEFGVETSEPEETVDSSDESPPPPPPPPPATSTYSSQPHNYNPLPPPPAPPISLTPTPPPTMPRPPPPPPMPPSLLLAPGSHLPGGPVSPSPGDNGPAPPPLMSLPTHMPPRRPSTNVNGDEACSSQASSASSHHSPSTSSSSSGKLPSPPPQHVHYSNGLAGDGPPAQTREVSSTGGVDLYPPSSSSSSGVRAAPRVHYNTPSSFH